MGKLLCEKNLRDVWCRNESVRAEIGQILHTHTHTHTRAAKLVVEILQKTFLSACQGKVIPQEVLYGPMRLFFSAWKFHPARLFK